MGKGEFVALETTQPQSDSRGRATARALAGTSQTFTVDLADRVNDVKQVVKGTPAVVAAYRYDGHGRRTSAAEEGIATVQVYSQAGPLMYQSSPLGNGIFRRGFQIGDTPYAASGGSSKRYVYLGRHLIAEDGTAGRQYIHTDGLGSPVRTTNANGAPSAREDYKPYGWGGPTQSAPGFTGHVADAKTGLIYMQARYYDPYVGRFLAVDPLAASTGSFNRYWYANNNPYTLIDPDGREGCAASRIGAVCAQHGWSNAQVAMGNDAMKQGARAVELLGGLSGAGGTLSSAYELVTGRSPLSGDEASRPWAAVGLIPYAKNLRYLDEVAGAAKGVSAVATESAQALPQLIKTNPKNLIPTQTKGQMSGSLVKRLANDMKKNGYDQTKPVDAVRNARGRLEIVDGHHRTAAAKRAGLDEIPVNVWGQ